MWGMIDVLILAKPVETYIFRKYGDSTMPDAQTQARAAPTVALLKYQINEAAISIRTACDGEKILHVRASGPVPLHTFASA